MLYVGLFVWFCSLRGGLIRFDTGCVRRLDVGTSSIAVGTS